MRVVEQQAGLADGPAQHARGGEQRRLARGVRTEDGGDTEGGVGPRLRRPGDLRLEGRAHEGQLRLVLEALEVGDREVEQHGSNLPCDTSIWRILGTFFRKPWNITCLSVYFKGDVGLPAFPEP